MGDNGACDNEARNVQHTIVLQVLSSGLCRFIAVQSSGAYRDILHCNLTTLLRAGARFALCRSMDRNLTSRAKCNFVC